MGKMLAKKATTKVSAGKSTQHKSARSARGTYMSHQDDTPIILVLVGEMQAGKTFLMTSASDYLPRDKAGNVALPAKKRIVLRDMFWYQVDSRATAGFEGENITVETFDLFDWITENSTRTRTPTIIEAIKAGLKSARSFCFDCREAGIRPKIAIDTFSRLNHAILAHFERETVGSGNQYEKYKLADVAHRMIDYELRRMGADLFFACHRMKYRIGDKEKDDTSIVRVVGEAKFGPAVSGKAIRVHKWDEPAQFVIRAWTEKKGGKRIWKRELLLDINDYGEETKNRWRAILPERMEADLGKVFKLIKEGKRIER